MYSALINNSLSVKRFQFIGITLVALGISQAAQVNANEAKQDKIKVQEKLQEKDWEAEGNAWIRKKKPLAPASQPQKAKNIILFVGDGMGISTVTASRIRKGQLAGQPGEEALLNFESFPYSGLVKTYNTDAQVPDSAGTMTAMMSGHKTRKGLIGLDSSTKRGDCEHSKKSKLVSFADIAKAHGKKAGIVTTTRLTHATPAAVYAHSADRDWENDAELSKAARKAGCQDIAGQLIDALKQKKIDVALGGGRRNFLPKAEDGRRLTPLVKNSDTEQYKLLSTIEELQNAKTNRPVLGLFAKSHMPYADENAKLPTLAELTKNAIRLLENKRGFFLMVEAGRIDHAHHLANAYHALGDTLALDDAVGTAMSLTKESETLIIVTADHSHVMTIAGYPPRGNPILGIAGIDQAGTPYTTLGYANGRGHAHLPKLNNIDARYKLPVSAGRKNIDPHSTQDPNYFQETLVGLEAETHGGEDVGVWASGPSAYLLTGTMEQTIIFYAMKQALEAK